MKVGTLSSLQCLSGGQAANGASLSQTPQLETAVHALLGRAYDDLLAGVLEVFFSRVAAETRCPRLPLLDPM